eukprot:gene19415-biopygen6060
MEEHLVGVSIYLNNFLHKIASRDDESFALHVALFWQSGTGTTDKWDRWHRWDRSDYLSVPGRDRCHESVTDRTTYRPRGVTDVTK